MEAIISTHSRKPFFRVQRVSKRGHFTKRGGGGGHILHKSNTFSDENAKSHRFSRLPVHLPNEKNVIIRERNGETDIFFNLEKKNKLLDYFDLNKRDSLARQYYYYEIPEHFTWKQNQCEWAKRKGNENSIERMSSANPCQVELFYLRL